MISRKDRTITRQDLAEAASRATGLPRTDASEIVAQILTLMGETLVTGETVLLSGFGKFVIVDRAPRRARNVRVGLEVIVGPRRAMVFRPATGLVRRLSSDKPLVDQATGVAVSV